MRSTYLSIELGTPYLSYTTSERTGETLNHTSRFILSANSLILRTSSSVATVSLYPSKRIASALKDPCLIRVSKLERTLSIVTFSWLKFMTTRLERILLYTVAASSRLRPSATSRNTSLYQLITCSTFPEKDT